MERICILLDLNNQGLDQSWAELVSGQNYALKINYISMEELAPMLETGTVVAMVLFAEQAKQEVGHCLSLFRKYVGPLPAFQAIVAEDPEPFLISQVFEYGVEECMTQVEWPLQLVDFTQRIADLIDDPSSIEAKALKLNWSIVYGDQGQILQSKEALGEAVNYDYVAAYAKANALQAVGQFGEAAEAFRASEKLNKTFRMASSGLGETLLVMGKVDEAIEILERLEKQNSLSVERKTSLATAYVEKGQKEKSDEMLRQAEGLAPGHPRILEARAEILLAEGKVGEAFKMMDNLQDVGPSFAAKLNEMGIKLSQQGKGKNALALYKKAHKIVRHELRYKISLNAALACYRLTDYQVALQYLARCEKEYGGPYEKVEKVRQAIKKVMTKTQTQKVG